MANDNVHQTQRMDMAFTFKRACPEPKKVIVGLRITERQRAKLDELGGQAWIRSVIDRAVIVDDE